MNFGKKQPSELSESELQQQCSSCKSDLDLKQKQCTMFRGKWIHIYCWKKIVGI